MTADCVIPPPPKSELSPEENMSPENCCNRGKKSVIHENHCTVPVVGVVRTSDECPTNGHTTAQGHVPPVENRWVKMSLPGINVGKSTDLVKL